MKVAVTGASGFIGKHVCQALSAAGHEVDARSVRLQDTLDFTAHCVVHLAGIAHRQASREELEEANVRLAQALARHAASIGASFVFLSTVKVHGEESRRPLTEQSAFAPQDAYAESKARAEELLQAVPGLRLTVLRPPLVYGAGVKANFLALMRALDRGWPLPLASVGNRRSLIYAGNLADAIVRTLRGEGTYLVSDGSAISTAALCRELAAALGRTPRLFAWPVSLLPQKLAASLEVDDSALRRSLGWRPPHSRQAGLRATADWYRARR
jgi:nucleoside-diphosphate-sugar epimerase